jgi:hypothetical protein
MVKINTVWKWWGHRQVGLCIKFAAQGVIVRPLPYDDLSEGEQEIVYHYWSTGELLQETQQEPAT